MCPGGAVDAVVSFKGNHSTERQRVIGVAKPPDVFYLFIGQGGDFFKVEI